MKNINLLEYKAVVFDVDGTLYYQNKLRILMALKLIKFVLKNPLKLSDLLMILSFRKIREHAEKDEGIYEEVAKKFKTSAAYVEKVIKTWIYEIPLECIKETRDDEITKIIEILSEKGVKIFILSDYKAKEKLEAMGIKADKIYTAEDENIKEFKPSPKGLNVIMDENNLKNTEIIMIGDRDVKDGEAARRAEVSYIILSKSKAKRKKFYEGLGY